MLVVTPGVNPVHLVLQADYQERVDPNDKQAQSLLEEMRAHVKKVQHTLMFFKLSLLKAPVACNLKPCTCS